MTTRDKAEFRRLLGLFESAVYKHYDHPGPDTHNVKQRAEHALADFVERISR